MKEFLKNLDKDEFIEIWTVKAGKWDDGFIKGKVLRVYDDGISVANRNNDIIFIPFRAILKIVD